MINKKLIGPVINKPPSSFLMFLLVDPFKYLFCSLFNHKFVLTDAESSERKYICKHCGAFYFEVDYWQPEKSDIAPKERFYLDNKEFFDAQGIEVVFKYK